MEFVVGVFWRIFSLFVDDIDIYLVCLTGFYNVQL